MENKILECIFYIEFCFHHKNCLYACIIIPNLFSGG